MNTNKANQGVKNDGGTPQMSTVGPLPDRPDPKIHPQDKERLDKTYLAWLQSADYEPWGQGKTVAKPKVIEAIKRANQMKKVNQRMWSALQEIWQKQPERVWIWSDLHLFHHRIIQLTGRPFADEKAMRAYMLEGAGQLGEDDWLVCLGDISFERDWQGMGRLPETARWLRQIKAHKVLIMGNHDLNLMDLKDPILVGFKAIAGCLELAGLTGEDRKLWLTHYPMTQGWLHGNFNVHGHTHQKRYAGPYANVSVEWMDYRPQRLMDVVTGKAGSNQEKYRQA